MSSKKQKDTTIPAVYKPIANGIAPPKEMAELQNKVRAGIELSPFETKRMQIYNYVGALLNHAEAMRVWRMQHIKQHVTLLPAMQLEQVVPDIPIVMTNPEEASKEAVSGPN